MFLTFYNVFLWYLFQEMIAKVEYDKVIEKHSKDMLFMQEEYEYV